jgi:hypothetical protein
MLLYMAATNRVVSIVIVVECKEEAQEYGVQRPVYYVSEVLTEIQAALPSLPEVGIQSVPCFA